MRTRKSVAALLVVFGIVVLALVVAMALPREGAAPVVVSATPTASPTVAAQPAASPSVTAALTPSARLFTSPLGYTVALPVPYRRSELQSFPGPRVSGDPDDLGHDLFTARDPTSEADAIRRSDTGPHPGQTYTAHVGVRRNSRGLSATAYAESVKGAYGFFVVSIDSITVEGRSAARLNVKYTRDDPKTFYELFIADADRMWVVGYFPGTAGVEVPPGASDDAVKSIADSFRFAR